MVKKKKKAAVSLKRTLSFPYLLFYGLGTIIGAGIYVLIGEVAAKAGLFAPVSFIIAAIIAMFTAISYAELSARLPYSAGVALYVKEAFNKKVLTIVVGLLVVLTGLVSAATLTKGFKGYFQTFFSVPDPLVIIGVVLVLTLIAIKGIKESVATAMVITIIEIAGLLFIIFAAGDSFGELPKLLPQMIPTLDGGIWLGILLGSFAAFFAFLGFEDMVNVAEEVKKPQKTIPKAIILSITVATLLYILVAFVALASLPLESLIGNGAPLATIYENATGKAPVVITIISLFAIINGALIQIIMGSRLLYGLASKGDLPKFLGILHPKTRTPINATLVIAVLVLLLTLAFDLGKLAAITSFIMLVVFTLVNSSLIVIKLKTPKPRGVHVYPMCIPVIGLITSAIFVVFGIINFIS